MSMATTILMLLLATRSLAGAAAAPAGEGDPPEVALGERLFLETRFAQLFAVASGGDANAPMPSGDPALDRTIRADGRSLPGPYAGGGMNCRACHLVDEHAHRRGGGSRAYADFARRSPLPGRPDGRAVTARNTSGLVDAAWPRVPLLMHADGEFTTVEALARETLLGRDYGWLASERPQALAHVAHIIRGDDGRGPLARERGGPYRSVLAGRDASIPPPLRLPAELRIEVSEASDQEIVEAVARLLAAYLRSLAFSRDATGAHDGSPYDRFLARNGLPRAPAPGESDLQYGRRLRDLLAGLPRPVWVGRADGRFQLHRQRFVFGAQELAGLAIFLRETAGPAAPPAPGTGTGIGIGNCLSCHPPPHFTDFAFHNTGAAQSEYDAIHGPGAFAALEIPTASARAQHPARWLPPSALLPLGAGPFQDIPGAERPGRTDLGLWNVFANPAAPGPQPALRALLCREGGACNEAALLERSIARFKTPGLRDLGHSAPYLHTGQADTLDDVLALYERSASLARDGRLRNPAPELAGMVLGPGDRAALAAFLRALNEDYQ